MPELNKQVVVDYILEVFGPDLFKEVPDGGAISHYLHVAASRLSEMEQRVAASEGKDLHVAVLDAETRRWVRYLTLPAGSELDEAITYLEYGSISRAPRVYPYSTEIDAILGRLRPGPGCIQSVDNFYLYLDEQATPCVMADTFPLVKCRAWLWAAAQKAAETNPALKRALDHIAAETKAFYSGWLAANRNVSDVLFQYFDAHIGDHRPVAHQADQIVRALHVRLNEKAVSSSEDAVERTLADMERMDALTALRQVGTVIDTYLENLPHTAAANYSRDTMTVLSVFITTTLKDHLTAELDADDIERAADEIARLKADVPSSKES